MERVTHEVTLQRVKFVDDGEEFDARFIMSASSPDRVHDTIEPSAYKSVATPANKKIIALFNHDSGNPIGYWSRLEAGADRLTGYIKLASTNLGKMVKALLDSGVPLGASVSIIGKGKPNDKGGIHFSSIDIIECSIVSTPAHPRALQIAKSYGFDLRPSEAEPTPAGMSTRKAEALRKARAALARK